MRTARPQVLLIVAVLFLMGAVAAAEPRVAPVAGVAPTGSISGTVTRSSGGPAVGVTVSAEGYYSAGNEAITDASGKFTIAGLPPGAYRVQFVPDPSSGLEGEFFDDVADYVSAHLVQVGSGAVTGIDAVLKVLWSTPGAPTSVQGTPGDRSVAVSWTAPATDGGAAITSYKVKSAPGGKECTWASGPLSCTVTGLTNGTAYTFTVTASNKAGEGPPSVPSAAVVPRTTPGAPVSVTAKPGDSQAVVSWVPPSSDGGAAISSYTVTAEPGGATCSTTGGTSCTVPGLSNGTGYSFTVVAANVVGPGPVSASSPPVTPGSRFFGVSPKRLLDSRDGTGGYSTRWGPGTSRDVLVAGGSTTVPAGATAVVLNVTGFGASAGTHLTVWPAGDGMPVASSLNLPKGAVRPNLVTVKVGTGGKVSIYNNAGMIDVIADVVGYFLPDEAGSLYTGVTPKRLLDSRDGTGGYSTPWGGGATRDVTVTGGSTSIPSGAAAVVLNMTVTSATSASHLTAWPAGEARPVASNMNFAAGETAANLVTVKVGTGGQVSVFNNAGNVQVIADVVGYYQAGSGAVFVPLAPVRLLDSRDGTGGYSSPWQAGQSRKVQVAGGATGVPVGAKAVVLNITGFGPTSATHLTVWPNGEAMPLASSLNLPKGEVRPNLLILKVGDGAQGAIFNNAGSVDVIADATGYYL